MKVMEEKLTFLDFIDMNNKDSEKLLSIVKDKPDSCETVNVNGSVFETKPSEVNLIPGSKPAQTDVKNNGHSPIFSTMEMETGLTQPSSIVDNPDIVMDTATYGHKYSPDDQTQYNAPYSSMVHYAMPPMMSQGYISHEVPGQISSNGYGYPAYNYDGFPYNQPQIYPSQVGTAAHMFTEQNGISSTQWNESPTMAKHNRSKKYKSKSKGNENTGGLVSYDYPPYINTNNFMIIPMNTGYDPRLPPSYIPSAYSMPPVSEHQAFADGNYSESSIPHHYPHINSEYPPNAVNGHPEVQQQIPYPVFSSYRYSPYNSNEIVENGFSQTDIPSNLNGYTSDDVKIPVFTNGSCLPNATGSIECEMEKISIVHDTTVDNSVLPNVNGTLLSANSATFIAKGMPVSEELDKKTDVQLPVNGGKKSRKKRKRKKNNKDLTSGSSAGDSGNNTRSTSPLVAVLQAPASAETKSSTNAVIAEAKASTHAVIAEVEAKASTCAVIAEVEAKASTNAVIAEVEARASTNVVIAEDEAKSSANKVSVEVIAKPPNLAAEVKSSAKDVTLEVIAKSPTKASSPTNKEVKKEPTAAWGKKRSWSNVFGSPKTEILEFVSSDPVIEEEEDDDQSAETSHLLYKGKVEEAINSCKDGYHSINLLPRGLINKSFWCYTNCLLQALISCPAFLGMMQQLIDRIPDLAALDGFPFLSSFAQFVNLYSDVSEIMVPTHKGRMTPNNALRMAIPCEPICVYNLLVTVGSCQFEETHQQDAQEALNFLLNGLHDEIADCLSSNAIVAPDADSDGDEWHTQGPKGKGSCLTRTTPFHETPFSEIFWGEFRSMQTASGSTSANIQPFNTLLLNVQSPRVRTLEDAFDQLVSKEEIAGYTCYKTNKETTLVKHGLLQSLPKVLILHLNRFTYTDKGLMKDFKQVHFEEQLVIKKDHIYQNRGRKDKKEQRSYTLFAVVKHEGPMANKGHYICEVNRGANNWLHCDDSNVKSITLDDVLRYNRCQVPYLLFYQRNDTIHRYANGH